MQINIYRRLIDLCDVFSPKENDNFFFSAFSDDDAPTLQCDCASLAVADDLNRDVTDTT